MEYQKQSNGSHTILEHWGFSLVAIVAAVVTPLGFQVFTFFMNLSGSPWICFFVVSFALMTLGGGLIGYSKFPVYRSGHFFTFGAKSVPERLSGYYRWG